MFVLKVKDLFIGEHQMISGQDPISTSCDSSVYKFMYSSLQLWMIRIVPRVVDLMKKFGSRAWVQILYLDRVRWISCYRIKLVKPPRKRMLVSGC